MNKKEYGLYVFIESLDNDIRESYSKKIQEHFVLHSPVFCINTEEYGAKKPVFTVVLCTVWYRTAQPSNIITSASCVLVDTSTFSFFFDVDLPLGYLTSPVSVNNEVGTGASP